jgi:HD-GYP domain-containing protein (c-di-GMP phosphodiesterase class II)
MSAAHGLLDRISAFRVRLDALPDPIPEAEPIDEAPPALSAEVVAFRESVRRLVGAPPVAEPDAPLPKFTDRAHALLADAKAALDRQRAVAGDPHFAATDANDPLVRYHRATVAMLDSVVRMARGFPNSPGEQLKLCDGLEALLATVRDRLAVLEAAVQRRRADADRIDRLAGFFAALHTHQAVTIETVVALAEDVLADARAAKPIRFRYADPHSTGAHAGAPVLPAPSRYVAAHALNVAQVVARLTPYDYEWAARPLTPVVAALLMDCGMAIVPPALLVKAEALTADERRVVESHAKYGAELLLWRFPNLAGPLVAAVAAHHERPDGTGYPNALKGNDVPPLAQLLRVADVYAAMQEERAHRPASDSRAALTEVLLLAERGHADKDFSEQLLNLAYYPVGSVVELTDGRVGAVVANHPDRVDPRSPARPVVAVLADATGTALVRPEYLDLYAADTGSVLRGVPTSKARALLGDRHPDLV